MLVAVEVLYDKATRQWCVGMVAPPWIASRGRTRTEARASFLEAFRAYFEPPRASRPTSSKRKPRIESVTVA